MGVAVNRRHFLRTLLSSTAVIAGGLSLTQTVRPERAAAGLPTSIVFKNYGTDIYYFGERGLYVFSYEPQMIQWSASPPGASEGWWSSIDGVVTHHAP